MTIDRYHINDFIGGWFIGDFEPSLLKTEDFEISIKTHPKGEEWDKHFHKLATEYNYVFSGKVKIDEETYREGDIFVVNKGHVVDPDFLEDCTILCIKTPSVPGDKYICD